MAVNILKNYKKKSAFSHMYITHIIVCFLPENCVDCITNKYSQLNLIFEYFDLIPLDAAIYTS